MGTAREPLEHAGALLMVRVRRGLVVDAHRFLARLPTLEMIVNAEVLESALVETDGDPNLWGPYVVAIGTMLINATRAAVLDGPSLDEMRETGSLLLLAWPTPNPRVEVKQMPLSGTDKP